MRAIIFMVGLAGCGLALGTPAIGQTRAELDAANDDAYNQLEVGMADLQRIDADLNAMQRSADTLRTDRAARRSFAEGLRSRHASFDVGDDTTADAMYRALFDYRSQRAEQLRPLAAATRDYTHREECTAIRNLKNLRAKAATAEWKEALGALASPASDRPCLASDMLPDEPAIEQSVERSMQRFRDASRRATRFNTLAER